MGRNYGDMAIVFIGVGEGSQDSYIGRDDFFPDILLTLKFDFCGLTFDFVISVQFMD